MNKQMPAVYFSVSGIIIDLGCMLAAAVVAVPYILACGLEVWVKWR